MSLNIKNLSGNWHFHEDFHYGKDQGRVILKHEGKALYGKMTFTETLQHEPPFTVECIITGTCDSNKVTLESSQHRIIAGDKSIEYAPETRHGLINSQGEIVGSSCDEEGVEGVFILSREEI